MVIGFRTLGAIVLGTLVLFIWSALSHMVVINGVGYSVLENEAEVMVDLSGIPSGLFAFPAPPAWSGNTAPEALDQWATAYAAGPAGMLIIRPPGELPFSIAKLATSFLSQLVGVTLVALLASRLAGGFLQRFFRLALIGPVSVCAVAVIYWNWYAFPTAFFLAQVLDVTVGWALAGAVLAWLVPHVDLVTKSK